MPLASLGFHDENGERAAVRALLEEAPLDHDRRAAHGPGHRRSIVESRGADYLMTVKGNAPETFATLAGIDWERDATGGHEEASAKATGALSRIRTLTPLRGTVNYPHLKQIFRVERQRMPFPREPGAGLRHHLRPGRTGLPGNCWPGTAVQNHRTRDGPSTTAVQLLLAIILRRGKSVPRATSLSCARRRALEHRSPRGARSPADRIARMAPTITNHPTTAIRQSVRQPTTQSEPDNPSSRTPKSLNWESPGAAARHIDSWARFSLPWMSIACEASPPTLDCGQIS